MSEYIVTEQSLGLSGEVPLVGAKNSVLALTASLILTQGKSIITNVPSSLDVLQMVALLRDIGADVMFDKERHHLEVDTRGIASFEPRPEIMKKMRGSILLLGPLLSRFGKARVALPGGCLIGARPIDYHLRGLRKMGVVIEEDGRFLNASIHPGISQDHTRIVLEYPSVGATENIIMFAVVGKGETTIVNAAFEPEVFDLITMLRKMGAKIYCEPVSIIRIEGVSALSTVVHEVIPDRLEAGALLLATAITGGQIKLPDAQPDCMEMFLEKLRDMGHTIRIGEHGKGIELIAHPSPRCVDIKTYPYPGFPTDLQAPMMAAQATATGISIIEETIFENRMLHVKELQKMGAQISLEGSKAIVRGVDGLYGTEVVATDIRASCALVLAGLAAEGETTITGVHHWRRGYDFLERKLAKLGAKISLVTHTTLTEPLPQKIERGSEPQATI